MTLWRNNDVIITLYVHWIDEWPKLGLLRRKGYILRQNLENGQWWSEHTLSRDVNTSDCSRQERRYSERAGSGTLLTLQWRHNRRDSVSNRQRLDCLLNRLFRRRSKKTSKLRVTGLCEGNSLVNSPKKGPVMRKIFPFDDAIFEGWTKVQPFWRNFYVYFA